MTVSEGKHPKSKANKATFQNAQAPEMDCLVLYLFMKNGSFKISSPSRSFCSLYSYAFAVLCGLTALQASSVTSIHKQLLLFLEVKKEEVETLG